MMVFGAALYSSPKLQLLIYHHRKWFSRIGRTQVTWPTIVNKY